MMSLKEVGVNLVVHYDKALGELVLKGLRHVAQPEGQHGCLFLELTFWWQRFPSAELEGNIG